MTITATFYRQDDIAWMSRYENIFASGVSFEELIRLVESTVLLSKVHEFLQEDGGKTIRVDIDRKRNTMYLSEDLPL